MCIWINVHIAAVTHATSSSHSSVICLLLGPTPHQLSNTLSTQANGERPKRMDRKYAVVIVSDRDISASTEACVSDLLNGLATWLGPSARDAALPIGLLTSTSLFGVRFVVTSCASGAASSVAAFGSCGPRWLQQQLAQHAAALRAGAAEAAAATASSTNGKTMEPQGDDRLFRCLSGALLRVVCWLHRKHDDPASVSCAGNNETGTDGTTANETGSVTETPADVVVVVDHTLLRSSPCHESPDAVTWASSSSSLSSLSYEADVAFSVTVNSLARVGATVLVGVPQPASPSSEGPQESIQTLWGGRLQALAAATGGASWDCLTPSACLRYLYQRSAQRHLSLSDSSWERRRRRVATSYFVAPATGSSVAANEGSGRGEEQTWIVKMCSECMAFRSSSSRGQSNGNGGGVDDDVTPCRSLACDWQR